MKLWLVRHARPLVGEGTCYGASDVAADVDDTRACARALASALPADLPVRYSPLRRCAQLAEALLELRTDLRATTDPRLAELDFGHWEGVRWDAIPPDAYAAWTAAFGPHRFGGRESAQELLERVDAAYRDIRAASGQAVWITHAGVIRALSLLAQGIAVIERADQWPRQTLGWGEWQLLEL